MVIHFSAYTLRSVRFFVAFLFSFEANYSARDESSFDLRSLASCRWLRIEPVCRHKMYFVITSYLPEMCICVERIHDKVY